MSANATGTPTTNFSIPKFNTASDAPNGKGVNEMMDALDSLLASGAFATKPAGIASGEVPVWNGTTWVRSSVTPIGSSSLVQAAGFEYAYGQITAIVNLTATVEASADTIVAAPSITLDGSTPVWVEFFSPSVQPPSVASGRILFTLWEGSTDKGRISDITDASATGITASVVGRRKITPPASPTIYTIKAWQPSGTGGQVVSGAGGLSNYSPSFIRITKA